MINPTRDFSWPVSVVLDTDHKRLREWFEQVHPNFHHKRLVLFGAGIRGSIFAVLLKRWGYDDFCVVDSNKSKWGGILHGCQIVSPDYLLTHRDDVIVLVTVEDDSSILTQLQEASFVLDHDLFTINSGVYEDFTHELSRPLVEGTVILGDCGLTQISLDDQQTVSLGEMLKHRLGTSKTKVLAMHGMGMRSFYHVLRSQLLLGSSVAQLILTINFEVLTGKHHLLPRTQHAKLFERLVHLLPFDDHELMTYAEITKDRSKELFVDVMSKHSEVSVIENARQIFLMNYMYTLRKDTEDQQYLLRIIKLCNEAHITILPYIPPVNFIYAKEVMGEKFRVRYEQNIDTLRSFMEKETSNLLDLSFLLDPSEFASPQTVDETANYRGRAKIADALVRYVMENGIVQ